MIKQYCLTHRLDPSSIQSINGTQTGTITLGQCRPGSIGNERVLHIPQSSRTEASSSDGLASSFGHSLVADMQSAYSTVLCSEDKKSGEKLESINKWRNIKIGEKNVKIIMKFI